MISFLNHQRKGDNLPNFVSPKVIKNFFDKLQEKEKNKKVINHESDLKVGDLVKITEGTFINYEGKIKNLDEKKEKC